MISKPIPYGRQHITDEDIRAVIDTLKSDYLTQGPKIRVDERGSVIAIEDSGAGVCSARIAGYTTIGLAGGNIKESGTMPMCSRYCNNLAEILDYIEEEA